MPYLGFTKTAELFREMQDADVIAAEIQRARFLQRVQESHRAPDHVDALAKLYAEPFKQQSETVFSSHVANTVWNEDFQHRKTAVEMELEAEAPGRILRIDHTFKVAHKMQLEAMLNVSSEFNTLLLSVGVPSTKWEFAVPAFEQLAAPTSS